MNLFLTLNIGGVVLIILSLFMLVPVGLSIFTPGEDFKAMFAAFVLTLVSGAVFYHSGSHRQKELGHRDGFVIVTASWLMAALYSSLPYIFSGFFSGFTDPVFESMAGLTTTGATILSDIEALPKGLLLWRSMTQWIGGMGIILFALAVLPLIGAGGVQLFKAEVPEISVEKLRPKLVDTAKTLWIIYVFLTGLCMLLYYLGGMTGFDAINHGFTTLATGGFSTKNASMAWWDSPFIEYVCSVFMLLAGINYSLYFFVLRGSFGKILSSTEFKLYLTVTFITVGGLTLYNLSWSYSEFFTSFRYALFQAISVMTTTGYATADYEAWAPFSQAVIIVLMFFGGMIGSTSGGMKQVRILLMVKQIYREFYQMIHPRAVTYLKLDGRKVNRDVLGGVWGFLFLFLFIWVCSTVLVTLSGVDLLTASSTSISAIGNVGPALGQCGPTETYSALPVSTKWVLVFCMLAGRLEVYTVVILFLPGFWKNNMPARGKTYAFWAMGLALVVAAAWYYTSSGSIEVSVVEIKKRDFDITISAASSGTVMAGSESHAAFERAGIIRRIHVREGMRVEKDDLIIELDTSRQSLALKRSEALYGAAAASFRELRASLAPARKEALSSLNASAAGLDEAAMKYESIKSLFEKGYVSRLEHQAALLALDVAKSSHEAARAQSEAIESKAEAVEAARQRKNEAGYALETAQIELERSFVRAPHKGIIYGASYKLGQSVAAGAVAAVVVSENDPYVEAFFDEADAGAVRAGMKATLELDAWPDRLIPATVSLVSPVVTGGGLEARSFKVELSVSEPEDISIKPGMSVVVDVVVDQALGVLSVPSNGLFEQNGAEWAYVVRDGRAVLAKVIAGRTNWTWSEVLDGLKDRDMVIAPLEAEGLRDGARVKADSTR